MSNRPPYNPTKLEVGATGLWNDQPAEVTGRSALRSAQGNRWYEYYVKLGRQRTITLVYERGKWKQFEMIEPRSPLAVADARTLVAGKSFELDDRLCIVDFVSSSTVVFAVGRCPEGVAENSRADYVNSTCLKEMVVLSWTGEEIEFYVGTKVSASAVRKGFQLPEPSFPQRITSALGNINANYVFGTICVVLLIVVLVAFAAGSRTRVRTIDPPPVEAAPPSPLPDQGQITVGADRYSIAAHRVVEIDEMFVRFKRHEYELTDAQGHSALLLYPYYNRPHEWALLRQSASVAPFDPIAAGGMRAGAFFQLGSLQATVQRLFRTLPLDAAGHPVAETPTDMLRYGFFARTEPNWVMARWSETVVDLEVGKVVAEPRVIDPPR